MEERDRLWDVYVDAFLTASRVSVRDGRRVIDSPSMVGSVGTDEALNGRLLITTDSALDALRELGDPRASFIEVAASAEQVRAYLNASADYFQEHATAMVRDLDGWVGTELDPRLRIVSATVDGAEGSVPLVDAAAACLRADPAGDLTPAAFAQYLVSITGASLLAAVDCDGVVRATAGSAVFEHYARVFFVSTDPDWRGRGIGTAMTAAALDAAVDRGAQTACLAGSASGRSIYARLGFESVRPVVLFENLGP